MYLRSLISIILMLFSVTCLSQDGLLIGSFDWFHSIGVFLLPNEVNTDLLLLYTYQQDDPEKTEIRIVRLFRNAKGNYQPKSRKVVFETNNDIDQLVWTYNQESRSFLLVFLDGEIYDENRKMKTARVSIKGKRMGKVQTISQKDARLNYPVVTSANDTKKTPSKAVYLYVSWSYNPTIKKSGLVSGFLDEKGRLIGDLDYSIVRGDKHPYSHNPQDFISNGKTGYLLAEAVLKTYENIEKPTVTLLDSSGKFKKMTTLADEDADWNSMRIIPNGEGKFVTTWSFRDSLKFMNRIVNRKSKTIGPQRNVTSNPNLTDENDDAHSILTKTSKSNQLYQFFQGGKSDPTAWYTKLNPNGTAQNVTRLTNWDGLDVEGPQYIFQFWLAVAPIKGTDQFYCVVAFRNDGVEFRGYTIAN